MSTRKSSIFYGTLIALSSLVVGMVLASRLDLTPASFARTNLSVPATNSAPITGALDATTFRTIAHDQSPAVVSIIVSGKKTVPDMGDFFGFQFPFGNGGNGGSGNGRRGGRGNNNEQMFRGAGSGFIIDGKTGYIITNNHVVEDADEITVMLDNTNYEEDGLAAKVVGRDKLTDSALIQLAEPPKKPLPEVKFGDSAQISPGDWVVAIGNPFQFSNTVTVGVVSAVGRVDPRLSPVPNRSLEYIQTDAAINQGNSGGPLLNIRGEVIGVNTAIMSESGGNIGLGFAVPIDTVRDVLPQLRSGKVVRGRIGVALDSRPMTLEQANDLGLSTVMGAVVTSVDANGPAKAAGIHPGDVIVEFNGKSVKDNEDLISMVTRTAPGTTVPLKAFRAGKPQMLNVKVEELNLDAEALPSSRASGRGRPSVPEAPRETGFGMSIEPLTGTMARQAGVPNGKGGAVISDISPLSSAARAGVQTGDVILSVNDKDVASVNDVAKALESIQPGHTARVLVWCPDDKDEYYLTLRKR